MQARAIGSILFAFAMGSAANAQYRQGFNCGDNRAAEPDDGAVYATDRDYSQENGSGRIGGNSSRPNGSGTDGEIGGLVDSSQTRRMMSSRREDWDAYLFDVPNGDYLVSMHFLETSHHWKGLRVFSLEAEGQPLLTDLDIFDEAERKYALNFRRVVSVADGQLDIQAKVAVDGATMQGIHVEAVVDDGQAPPVPDGLRAVPGYDEVFLFWNTSYERTQLGIDIWRTDLTERGEEERITEHPTTRLRYRDHGAVVGHEYQYRMTAVDAAGNVSAPTAPVSATVLSRAESPIPFHELFVDDEDFRWLNQNRNTFDAVPAMYRIDGEQWDDAEVRYRGNTTRDLIKKNYKVRTSNGDPFPPGRLKINLQSEYRVDSLLREKLAYDLFTDSGALAGFAQYVNMDRNGEYVGVYDDFEQVDEYFLEQRGLEGSVWKATSDELAGDFRPRSWSQYYQDYVLEVGTYDDYEYLDDFCQMVGYSTNEEFRTEIYDYMKVDEFLNWYASQAIVSNWDHVVHNYYLFRDRSTGLFSFVPWDLELGWDNEGHPIDYGTRRNRWIFIFWNRLYNRFMTIDHFRRMYSVRLYELLDNEFSVERIQGLITDDYELIRADMERDMLKPAWDDMSQFDDDYEDLKSFIEVRHSMIREQLQYFSTDPFVNVFVNEAQLNNVAGLTDEAGDHDPWVEIYNLGNETIDLAGVGLTDDENDRGRWTFPAETKIAPKGHLLVWLDGEPEEGAMHASFRASSEAPSIILSYESGNEMDRMAVVAGTTPDLATGRVPDAGLRTLPLANATPAGANDPTRLVENSIETDAAGYYIGDVLTASIEVVNHRAFGWNLDVVVDAVGPPGTVEIQRTNLFIGSGESRTLEFQLTVPEAASVGAYDLESRVVAADLGAELHRGTCSVRVYDPRPVTLVVNEIMADNETTYDDGAEQYDDWIELYNTGDQTVDLTGLYLSDNPENPSKWRIPEESLDPGDHLVIWCDDDAEQGFLHATFKLDADGEEVAIYERDLRNNVLIDRVVFGEMNDDVAYGRSPDGSENLMELSEATPGDPNP